MEKREFEKLVKGNGYERTRVRGSHQMYQNKEGRTLVIPIRLNKMVMQRLIKEYGLEGRV